jgi:hypothetical protein
MGRALAAGLLSRACSELLNEKQHRKWCYSLDRISDLILDLSSQEPDPETTDVADSGLLLSRMLITVQT